MRSLRIFPLLVVFLLAAGLSEGSAATAVADVTAAGTIVFSSDRDGKYPYALHSVNIDGSGLRQLTDGVRAGSWTRDGRRLALVVQRGEGRDIEVLSADGTPSILDTGRDVGGFGSLVWSPGGRKIAYQGLGADDTQVTIIDVTSGKKIVVGPGKFPQWSPNGKWISFLRKDVNNRGFSELWVAKSDGSQARQLTSAIDEAKWSPDSKRLAYEQYDRLWVVNRDGSHKVEVADWLLNLGYMSWAPDGQRVAYESRDGAKEGGGYAVSVFVVDINGRHKHRLFTDISLGTPVWSPRGGEIAVSLNLGRLTGLYLIHPDGKGRRRVLDEQSVQPPIWSPDGRMLAVSAGLPGDVWVIDASSRQAHRITQGWRYGYGNGYETIRWLPGGLPAALLPGVSVEPTMTSDSIVAGHTLKTTRPINQIAADGATVAVHYARGNFSYDQPHDYRCLDSWNPVSGSLSRFAMSTCDRTHYCCSLGAGGFVDLTLAGGRLAWTTFYHFAGLDIFDLYTGTLERPRPVLVPGVCPDNSYGDCLFPEVDLQGDGSLLVFDTWDPSCANPSFPMSCSTSPKRNGRLWRLDGDRAVLMASSSGALTPLAVDAGRVLVDHQDGSLEVLGQNAASLGVFHYAVGSFLGAELQGRDLVVLNGGNLVDYDPANGTLLHEWPLGCGGATLADLQDGVVVYICGSYVHTLWLSDGTDVALPSAGQDPQAQLEAPGLYYSYQVDDPNYPGRVTFIPFDQLPHR